VKENGLKWLEALGPQKMRPGLSKTRALLAAFGNPQTSFRSVLIAGTNGKGSTAAACSSILRAAGLFTGLYTSPHLIRVTERIRILEEDVSVPLLDDVLSLVAAVSSPLGRGPTYFEALTAAAFELFRRARVDVAVVEVGIGGRLDATNVLEPEVSLVTNVSADHLEILGPTLEDVAREKAGVFRRGRPALTTATGAPLGVLRAEAFRIGARLVETPPDARFDDVSPLPGRHQRSNMALAVAGARALAPLDEETILRGLRATRWPGRLQWIERPGRRPLLLDGAHNPDGAAALGAYLDDEGLSGRVDLVFGGLADKDLAAVFAPLDSRARRIVLTAPDSPRAARPADLAARLGRSEAETADGPGDALARLDVGRDLAAPILVAGSLYLVGDVLRLVQPGLRSAADD
jgi:dihydrofolate synthase/folylpolyglutamate synthase